jgi:Flp pilus assembly protein TadD
VLRYNPEDYQAYGNLGFICLKAGRMEEAKKYFGAALRLNPEDEIARRNLAALQRTAPR